MKRPSKLVLSVKGIESFYQTCWGRRRAEEERIAGLKVWKVTRERRFNWKNGVLWTDGRTAFFLLNPLPEGDTPDDLGESTFLVTPDFPEKPFWAGCQILDLSKEQMQALGRGEKVSLEKVFDQWVYEPLQRDGYGGWKRRKPPKKVWAGIKLADVYHEYWTACCSEAKRVFLCNYKHTGQDQAGNWTPQYKTVAVIEGGCFFGLFCFLHTKEELVTKGSK